MIDISEVTANNDRMTEDMKVDEKIKSKAMDKLMEVVEMLDSEGVDGKKMIFEMLSGDDDPMGERPEEGAVDSGDKVKLIIAKMKRLKGSEEDEEA